MRSKKTILLGVIGSTPGQPYSDFNVATDRDNILALYYNEGFPEARFTATAEPRQAPTRKTDKSGEWRTVVRQAQGRSAEKRQGK